MPSVLTTPYFTANEILDAARAMSNDAQLSIEGNILANSQPYTFTLLQVCYEDLRNRLSSRGVNTFFAYAEILGLTPVATSDPTTQVQLSYVGYFDGAVAHGTPFLPSEVKEPLELWERGSVDPGTNTNPWYPMVQASDSISTRQQTPKFSIWDWETDILYLPGATLTNDLKMKFILGQLPGLTDSDSPVLIADCKTALASLLIASMARARGGTAAAADFNMQAEKAIDLLVNPTAQKEQYASFVRRPFRARRTGRAYR